MPSAVDLQAIGAEGMEVSVPLRGSARPRLPGHDQAPLLVDQLRRRRQPRRPARALRWPIPARYPDPAHRVVSPRVVRALRAMSGLARLAPTSSRLFAHATAGHVHLRARARAARHPVRHARLDRRAVSCDVAAQANLLAVFFTRPAHVHGGCGHRRRSLRRAARADRRHGPADARVPRAGQAAGQGPAPRQRGSRCWQPAARRSTPAATRWSP